jgi:hypothetical protein
MHNVVRDIGFEDPVIQEKYLDAMEKLGPAGRALRCFSLLAEVCQMLAHIISKENSDISARELRKMVAMRLYQGDESIVERIRAIK